MKLEVNWQGEGGTRKTTNTWRLNNMLLYNGWVNQETKEEIKEKFMETNEKENTMARNLRDAAKVVIRGKHIAIHTSLQKHEKSQSNKLTSH